MAQTSELSAIPEHKWPRQRGAEVSAALLSLAAVALGFAIHIHDGEYSPNFWGAVALGLLTLALLATIAAVAQWQLLLRVGRWRSLPVAVLAIGLALQFAAIFTSWPGVDLLPNGRAQLVPFYIGLALAMGVIVLLCFADLSLCQRLFFPVLLAIHLMLGAWMVRSSPNPHIDVWVFQQDAASALLSGRNPYAIRFPDIYQSTHPDHQPVYGPGLVQHDRLQFGFPYPPVSLLLATAGYAATGDHRYAQAVALVLAGLFIGYSRSARIAMLAAALFLFTPRVWFVLGRGWTEPFGLMFLAATIFLAYRAPKLLPLGLGLLLASKQYLVLAAPLSCFLVAPGWRWREWLALLLKSAFVAAVVTLPLALWNWREFWKATVTVQELAPFRWDALSFLVWYGFAGHGHIVTRPHVAFLWSSVASLGALGLVLWKGQRNIGGFTAGLALICLAFFAFNKQAFCNYYFFVIGALCCAVAAAGDPGFPSPAAET